MERRRSEGSRLANWGKASSIICSNRETLEARSWSDFPGVYALHSSGTLRATHYKMIARVNNREGELIPGHT